MKLRDSSLVPVFLLIFFLVETSLIEDNLELLFASGISVAKREALMSQER